MLYFSQILGQKVLDSSDLIVGKLSDLLIKYRAGMYSPLNYVQVKTKDNQEGIFIDYDNIESLSPQGITLKTIFSKVPIVVPDKDNIYLKKSVLDQQIVDTAGARVVRVNDIKLGYFQEQMCVLAVDVSMKGLWRRLSLDWLDVFGFLIVRLIDWRNVHPVKGMLKLNTISKDLIKLHPADLANILEDLNYKHGSKIVRSLDSYKAAKVLEEVDPHLQKALVHLLEPEQLVDILGKMSSDEVADLIKILPRHEGAELLSSLQNGKLQRVEKLLHFADNTAGGLMTTDFVSARPDWTVAQTIDEVKKLSSHMRSILYVYVTDKDGFFKGVVSLRHLLISGPQQKLKDVIKDRKYTTLRLSQAADEILKIMKRYDLYSAAVLDGHKKLMGIVSIDDVLQHVTFKPS